MADPTPPPVPPRAGDVYESWRRYARELAKVHGVWDEAVAAGRTAAAARILAKITEKQAEIDNPDTDAEVLSTLIDECEGLWMALRAADPATFDREHAAARIAEETR